MDEMTGARGSAPRELGRQRAASSTPNRSSVFIKNTIGITARIKAVAPDTLERSLGKAKRVLRQAAERVTLCSSEAEQECLMSVAEKPGCATCCRAGALRPPAGEGSRCRVDLAGHRDRTRCRAAKMSLLIELKAAAGQSDPT